MDMHHRLSIWNNVLQIVAGLRSSGPGPQKASTMSDIHTPVEISRFSQVVDFLMSDVPVQDNWQLEVWGYDCQGDTGSLIDEYLYLTHHDNRVVLCVGTYAKQDFVEWRVDDIRLRKMAEARKEVEKKDAIAEARRVLRMYGAGLEDDE